MAYLSIEKSQTKKGIRYRATVRVKKSGKVIRQESKTFDKKSLAKTWGENTKADFERVSVQRKDATINQCLLMFLNDENLGGRCGKTKSNVLKSLFDYDIANIIASKLLTSDLVAHCKVRKEEGASPATVYHDICYLKSLFKSCKSVYDINCDPSLIDESLPHLYDMNLVGRSARRTRRPTESEFEQIYNALKDREKRCKKLSRDVIPHSDILLFQVYSCCRVSETVALRWDDLDEKSKTIIVRNRKDPRKKEGNHLILPLLGKAFEIIQRQPRTSDKIFPYFANTITNGFQMERTQLGIKNFRYHDLRREGASRLFEEGYTIEQVAQVTGHRNLNTLWQIYTQLNPDFVHKKLGR